MQSHTDVCAFLWDSTSTLHFKVNTCVQYLYFVLEHVHVLNSAYTGPNITDGHWTITDHFCYMSDHAYKLSDKNVRAKSLE